MKEMDTYLKSMFLKSSDLRNKKRGLSIVPEEIIQYWKKYYKNEKKRRKVLFCKIQNDDKEHDWNTDEYDVNNSCITKV